MRFWALILAAALLPAHAFAAEHQFKKGEAVTIQQDDGYILVRTFPTPGGGIRGTVRAAPVLIRALSDEELQRANDAAAKDPTGWKDKIESNIVVPLADSPYAETKAQEFLLTSLKPGMYVLGGLTVTNWAMKSTGVVIISLCMGTVAFEVKPGVITDLGAILSARDDQPTTIPELSKVVSGKPTPGAFLQVMAVRPATPEMETPEALKALPLARADYRAQGALPLNYIGAPVSRLAPLPGVLDYDADGQVVDLRSASGASQ